MNSSINNLQTTTKDVLLFASLKIKLSQLLAADFF